MTKSQSRTKTVVERTLFHSHSINIRHLHRILHILNLQITRYRRFLLFTSLPTSPVTQLSPPRVIRFITVRIAERPCFIAQLLTQFGVFIVFVGQRWQS